MTMAIQADLPLVWMNMTTSAGWTRPAVGVVRVEQSISKVLQQIYGDRFRQCIWMDGQFVEWHPGNEYRLPEIDQVVDLLLPQTASFDLARRFVGARLEKFKKRTASADRGRGPKWLDATFPLSSASRTRPGAGDVLISVGLDWDQPYSREFFNLRKTQQIKIVTCCYDLIPVLFPQYCVGDVAARFIDYFNQLNWGSSAVLCISKQTRRDLLDLWEAIGAAPRPTQVIPLGDNVPSTSDEISAAVADITSEPFILFVSTIERRKNHEALYRAYHLLARSGWRDKLPKLVLVGMEGWGVNDLMSDINLDPHTKGLIVQLHHVSDGELRELYEKAMFCVYPSFYEGWGLPVGEALSLGKAVLSSDQGSLPEVGGDLVKYVSPWDSKAWADAILEWVMEPDTLATQVSRVKATYQSRTWTDTGKAVAEVIDRLLETQSADLRLLPGYDCRTVSGVHVGPALHSHGHEGYVMFGPYLSLKNGDYKFTIRGKSLPGTLKGSAAFDVAFGLGQKRLAKHSEKIEGSVNSENEQAFSVCLDVNLDAYAYDIEIRCRVPKGVLIAIEEIVIEQSNADIAILRRVTN